MCAGAHNRSAAIEQTRKDRSEVDASRHQKRAAANIERAVGAPKWQLTKKCTSNPRALSMHARRSRRSREGARRRASSRATRPGASPSIAKLPELLRKT
jgi:hypothetical protein